jgi:hypothetical protein
MIIITIAAAKKKTKIKKRKTRKKTKKKINTKIKTKKKDKHKHHDDDDHEESHDDSGSGSSSGKNPKWVGFRFSQGGVKKSFGAIPTPDEWVSHLKKIRSHIDGKPVVIVIVSENSKNKICGFGFPAPSGYSSTSVMKFGDKDKFEDILNKFDKEDVNVWLQVEPGDNDLITLSDIVFKKYGHHSCVQGFGVDLEWWYRQGDHHPGKAIDDSTAEKLVKHIRSKNSKYTVFIKHWKENFMPSSYREGLIFVDDSQGLHSMENAKKEFSTWAKKFKGNPVMFQIGYKDDKSLWERDPVKFANEIKDAVMEKNDQVGIIWVDFTMKQALDKM